LLREYKKKRNQLRTERQDYPKISFGEARKKLFEFKSVSENSMMEGILLMKHICVYPCILPIVI
jgi:hypothetical protein